MYVYIYILMHMHRYRCIRSIATRYLSKGLCVGARALLPGIRLLRPEFRCGSPAWPKTYLWLVGNGGMVVIVVIIVPHSSIPY